MSSEKNIIKWSKINVGRDLVVGDNHTINNIINYIKEDKDTIVIFILAMSNSYFEEIKENKIDEIDIRNNGIHCFRNLYIKDHDDDIDDIIDFFLTDLASHGDIRKYYSDTSEEWIPFIHDNPNAPKSSIKELIEKMLYNRNLNHLCLEVDLNHFLDNKEDFYNILEKSILIIDPISLLHPKLRDFFENIYSCTDVGGVIIPTCYSIPKEFRRLSTLLIKRLAYRWHRKKTVGKRFFLNVSQRENFEHNLISVCEEIIERSIKREISPFLLNKHISDDTKELGF